MEEQPRPRPTRSKLVDIPGVERLTRIDPWWGLVVLVVGLTVILVTVSADPFRNIVVFVSDGILVTIIITVTSFLFILIVGMLGGLGRLSRNWLIHGVATLYVEIVRGIPLLVQLLAWYFAFPVVVQGIGRWLNISAIANYRPEPIFTAIIALTVCYGAYMSEIYRAGIQSIPKGQTEAARSLGMTHLQSLRHVILPQAVRVILPPVGNELIALLKDSCLVSVVAVHDLTRRGREYMAVHFNPIEVWAMVALLYLVLTLFLTRGVAWIEKKARFER